MRVRTKNNRRIDRWSAERIDLAALTARAFDLTAARNYLRLSGVDPALVEGFAARYPFQLRANIALRTDERRKSRSSHC